MKQIQVSRRPRRAHGVPPVRQEYHDPDIRAARAARDKRKAHGNDSKTQA